MLKHLAYPATLTLVLCTSAQADMPAVHRDSMDPLTEGWTDDNRDFLDVSTYAVVDDEGLGVDAWAIDDYSTDGGSSGTYIVELDQSAIDEALKLGWQLRAKLRIVVGVPPSNDSSVHVGFHDGSREWGMMFGKGKGDSPVVALRETNTTYQILLPDLDAGYHTYELRFDPVGEDADLYVDGVLHHSGFVARSLSSSPEHRSVYFGSTYHDGEGHGNYNHVSFTFPPCLCDCEDPSNGTVDVGDFLALLAQ
ncbi:MAG: hypothetical protein ACYTAS_20470, partial [Planctomycetota bacterium]